MRIKQENHLNKKEKKPFETTKVVHEIFDNLRSTECNLMLILYLFIDLTLS